MINNEKVTEDKQKIVPDLSISPTPFLGFSSPKKICSSAKNSSPMKKEGLKKPELTPVRVSQPRTTKSRASLVWQKYAVKEEPSDELQTKKPPKEKAGSTTTTKPKVGKIVTKAEEDTTVNGDETESEKEKLAVIKKAKKIRVKDIKHKPSTSTAPNKNLKKKRKRTFKAVGKGFKCDQCGKSYKYLRGMRQHQKLECNVEPQFPCPYCPNKFRYRHGIREHVRVHHEQAFPKWYAAHYVMRFLKQSQTSTSEQE
ncbi:zinc finger and BTB domain-containing protein 24-like isoform X3 [Macrosteles quadrilineatus]|uniref:zinc finger and BTB domain-containing protein 24-like isoform X3 n=1 Tax=Macrosteles quadrilineatus TaxID=74068 RepID=UPI0023E0C5F2|nr:zinc finger and BTB domain-containing protein 24-like isoform X3 [Macrosteles quadrilineatus]